MSSIDDFIKDKVEDGPDFPLSIGPGTPAPTSFPPAEAEEPCQPRGLGRTPHASGGDLPITGCGCFALLIILVLMFGLAYGASCGTRQKDEMNSNLQFGR